MHILTIADLHGPLKPEEIDFIKQAEDLASACFLLGDIPYLVLEDLKKMVNLPLYAVLGNHDEHDYLEALDIENIHGRIVEVDGRKFLGVSGSPRYKREPRSVMFTQAEMCALMSMMPYADVLISHDSGHFYYSKDDAHCGFLGISNYIQTHRPKYNIHGHHHTKSRRRVGSGQKTCVICTYRVELHNLSF